MRYDIIIVDSGCDRLCRALVSKSVEGLTLKKSSEGFVMNPDCIDEIGHGTAIAKIALDNDPTAKILAINAFGSSTTISEDALLFVLHYILRYYEPTVISLSCGHPMSKHTFLLERVCCDLRKMGFILLAAHSNDYKTMLFPASFSSVYGVDIYHSIVPHIYFLPKNGANFLVGSKKMRVPWLHGKSTQVHSTSYAVPIVAGILSKAIRCPKDTMLSMEKLINSLCLTKVRVVGAFKPILKLSLSIHKIFKRGWFVEET